MKITKNQIRKIILREQIRSNVRRILVEEMKPGIYTDDGGYKFKVYPDGRIVLLNKDGTDGKEFTGKKKIEVAKNLVKDLQAKGDAIGSVLKKIASEDDNTSGTMPQRIEKTSDKAGAVGKVLGGIGITAQAVRKFLSYSGVGELQETAMQASRIPLHIGCLYNFLTLKQSAFEIDSNRFRRALYYACKAAQNRGSSSLKYDDYYDGQLLDPQVEKAEPIVYSAGHSSGYKQVNPGVYGQLSLVLGEANIKKAGDSFFVTDQYNFNLDKHKKSWAETGGYVPTLKNIAKIIGVNFFDIFKKILEKAGLLESGTDSLHRIVEDMCVMYEVAFKYKGYKVTCQTLSKSEAEK